MNSSPEANSAGTAAGRQIKLGSLLSYIQIALNILIGLIYTPIMIKLLGRSEYGLYNTVASTVAMLSILNLGFSSGYIRYFAKYKQAGDESSIARLNGLFLIIFLVIGAVAFACGMFLTQNLRLVFDEGLTESELETAKLLMLLLTVNLTVSFPMSVFANMITANERFIFLKLIGMAKNVLSPLLTIPLLLMGHGSVAIVIVTMAVSFTVDAVYVFYVLFVLRERFVFRDFPPGIFRSLAGYTAFIAINMVIDQVNWNVDKVLLGRFRGTEVVAVYSVGAVLQTYYNTFSTSLSGIFSPRIHKIANDPALTEPEKDGRLSGLFTKVGRVQFIILALIMSGFVFFGREFIGFWVGEGYEESYFVALMLMLPVTVPLIQNVGIEIQRAKNLHRFRSLIYLGMAVINLVLTVFLAPRFGAVGAAFGTAVSLIVANGVIMNIYYHKRCGINVVSFWANIARLSLGLILPAAVGAAAMLFLKLDTVWKLLLAIIGYTAVYAASMWLIGMNEGEKQLVLSPLKRLKGVRK